ncbi:MAG: SpoIID/LytB domain-containing protein, partial [Tepidisphaeraceae bacterium]
LLLLPLGCSQNVGRPPLPASVPVVRVRLLESQQQVNVTATEPPIVRTSKDPELRRLNFPEGVAVQVGLSSSGSWQVGNVTLGQGELTMTPATEGTVAVNGQAYRGRFRLVPVGSGKFDVVNDVDIDGYLKSVVPKEMLRMWDVEAYKAQAIVARTYALYESKTSPTGRHWDVFDDQRSQVYGGIGAESSKAREAVDATTGVVVAHGDPGRERIFKAYFSSCCGGITQSAADAFGDAYLPPLSDQNNHSLCNASPRFNWGPVAIRKEELGRRIRLWGERRGRPEKNIATISRIDVQAQNRWGRPTRFVITDARGLRYSLGGEEIRWAINTDAPDGSTLYSSFFKTINDPESVRFIDGHGFGHGVGMCQWCSQRRAEEGMRHEDIVLAAFQRSRLVRAY